MKRTPIIVPGQVYLHPGYNEYLVVTKVNRTEISFGGQGFSGMHDSDLFLERFGPVDPTDLNDGDRLSLQELTSKPLSTGWVTPEDDGDDEYDD